MLHLSFPPFLGNKNIAMAIGTVLAMWLWARQCKLSPANLWAATAKPLEIAGTIILITSAGGAFGAMIKHSGIGDAIELATNNGALELKVSMPCFAMQGNI